MVCGAEDHVGAGDVCLKCWKALLPSRGLDKLSWIDSITVGFLYDDRLRRIVHRFKFENVPGLAEPLANRLADHLDHIGRRPAEGILLPVPTHPARLRERGYNPSELIAVMLARRWGLPCDPSLAKRIKAGPHQSALPDEQRTRTLQGAFRVAPPPEGGRDIPLVLFDDVIHTGTTLRRLAEAAKKAGWRKIDAVCLCS